MLRRLLLATVLGTLLVLFLAQCDTEDGANEPSVALSVNPANIDADGQSMAEITITVTNYSGTVVLSTNRGTFTESQSETLGMQVSGSAKTLIQSCREGLVEDCVGTASIKATADTALGFASLRFLSTGAGGAGGGGPICAHESVCDNGGDEDGDGHVDCDDDDCCSNPLCLPGAGGAGGAPGNDCTSFEVDCTDLQDNDGDNRTDCEDSNCCEDPACAGAGGAGGGGGTGGSGGGGPNPESCISLDPDGVYMYGVLAPAQAWPAFSRVTRPLSPCLAFPNRVITDLTVRPGGGLVYLVPGYRESPSFESTVRTYSPTPIDHLGSGDWLYPQFREADHPTIMAPGCTPGEPTRAFVGQGNEVFYQCNREIDYWQEVPARQLDTLGKQLVAVGEGALLTMDETTSQYYLMTGDWFDGSASETTLTFPVGVPANAELLAVRPFGTAGFRIVVGPHDQAGPAQRITFTATGTTLDGSYSALPPTHGRYYDYTGDGVGSNGYDFVPNAVLDSQGDLWEVLQTLDISGVEIGLMAVAERHLGGAATELIWQDSDFTDTSQPPEMHMTDVRNPVGLFTGVDAGSGGGEGGAGGGGAVGDMNDCWTNPDGTPATQDVIKVTGTVGVLGPVSYTSWGTVQSDATDTGITSNFPGNVIHGTPSLVPFSHLWVKDDSPIAVGEELSDSDPTPGAIGWPIIEFSIHQTDNDEGVGCPDGSGTGTGTFDRLLPNDFSPNGGVHGVFAYQCPASNIDVHGCFRMR